MSGTPTLARVAENKGLLRRGDGAEVYVYVCMYVMYAYLCATVLRCRIEERFVDGWRSGSVCISIYTCMHRCLRV